MEVTAEVIYSLPDKLRSAQGIFTATGGLHTAALHAQGQLLKLREDVGHHNTLDKWWVWQCLLWVAFNHIVMVSGRSSFEILQKCLQQECQLCAVSAP